MRDEIIFCPDDDDPDWSFFNVLPALQVSWLRDEDGVLHVDIAFFWLWSCFNYYFII